MDFYNVKINYVDGASDIVSVPFYPEDEVDNEDEDKMNIMPATNIPFCLHYEVDTEMDLFEIQDSRENCYFVAKYSLIKSISMTTKAVN